MFVATAIVSTLLAALLAFSAIRKLSHDPEVVQGYLRAGVPEERLDLLAFTLFAGAAGLLLGLVLAPIGIAAAAALVCYFLVAILAHLRSHDAAHVATPVVLAILAAVALTLRLSA